MLPGNNKCTHKYILVLVAHLLAQSVVSLHKTQEKKFVKLQVTVEDDLISSIFAFDPLKRPD